MLPVDIIAIRHGQSEGNVANRRSRGGDHSLFTPEFRDRHSRAFRLTDRGIDQAKIAGDWLRQHGITPFDRYLVSDYIRAKETAVGLAIPGAKWSVEYQLRERDTALMDNLSVAEKNRLFEQEVRAHEIDRFFSYPAGGGESFASFCLRIKTDVIAHLARDYSSMKVGLVCHGHVMRALQMELLNLGHDDFIHLDKSQAPKDKIHNCQIMWYTRRDPETKQIVGDRLYAWRSLCPWKPEETDTGWIKVERKRFSNEDLAAEVSRYPRHVT